MCNNSALLSIVGRHISSHQGWPDRPTPRRQLGDYQPGHAVTVDIRDGVGKSNLPVCYAHDLIEHVILRSIR